MYSKEAQADLLPKDIDTSDTIADRSEDKSQQHARQEPLPEKAEFDEPATEPQRDVLKLSVRGTRVQIL